MTREHEINFIKENCRAFLGINYLLYTIIINNLDCFEYVKYFIADLAKLSLKFYLDFNIGIDLNMVICIYVHIYSL